MSELDNKRNRNITVSFRLSESEKKMLDAKVQASGMPKSQYYLRSNLYNRVVVVGKREHINRLIDELHEMEMMLKVLLDEIKQGDIQNAGEKIKETKEDYIAMINAIYEIAIAGNRDIK